MTKYAAEYGNDGERIPILFSTASKISLASSVIVGAGIVLFANYASEYFLKSVDYSYVFVIFGFTIVLFVSNNLLLSILNGLQEIKTWVMINIIQSIYCLIFTTLLIVLMGLDGALIALVTNQSVIFLIVLCMLRKNPIIKVENFKAAFDKAEAMKLSSFAIMTMITLITVPLSVIIVRNFITETHGLEEAGYWQAIWYISSMSLLIFMTVIKVYFLPKLSETENKKELRFEIIQGLSLFLFIALLGFSIIYFLKEWIVLFLFTRDFLPMVDLFFWQLIGDFFKLAGTLFGILLAAKSKNVRVIITNVLFSLLFVLFVYLYIEKWG